MADSLTFLYICQMSWNSIGKRTKRRGFSFRRTSFDGSNGTGVRLATSSPPPIGFSSSSFLSNSLFSLLILLVCRPFSVKILREPWTERNENPKNMMQDLWWIENDESKPYLWWAVISINVLFKGHCLLRRLFANI